MSGFVFPDGVELLGESEDSAHFNVSIPVDDDGYFGRECPDCHQYYRVHSEDYEALPDDVRLWCVYCGHEADHSDFITEQQMERVRHAASGYAQQLLSQHLDRAFGGTGRRSRTHRSGFVQVHVEYRSRPYFPDPLPQIDEEQLIRQRYCEDCGLRYAVFGEHRFRPACGPLSPDATATDALLAEKARLDVLQGLDPEAIRSLREQGILDRTYADTVKNVVGIVEHMAERTLRDNVRDADMILKGKGKVFQRLDDLADLFESALSVQVRTEVKSVWPDLLATWATRHVLVHCDGVVDAKYLTAVPESQHQVGQRLRVSEEQARRAIELAGSLCTALARHVQ